MLTLIIMPMISVDKLTTTMLMEEKLTSSSLLWLPDRSSWMEEPCSNRLLLEEAVVSILEEAGVILEDPEGLLEEFGSKMSAAGVITTSVATSPSGRRIWDIRKWLQNVPERERECKDILWTNLLWLYLLLCRCPHEQSDITDMMTSSTSTSSTSTTGSSSTWIPHLLLSLPHGWAHPPAPITAPSSETSQIPTTTIMITITLTMITITLTMITMTITMITVPITFCIPSIHDLTQECHLEG